MIQEYFTFCEYIIQQSPLVISYTTHIVMGSPSMGHIQGVITFVDGSELTFFELLSQDQAVARPVKYRFHYQKGNQFIFRYDNAPHHQELPTFLKPQTYIKRRRVSCFCDIPACISRDCGHAHCLRLTRHQDYTFLG